MPAAAVNFYTAVVAIDETAATDFHQHLTDLLADLRARGAVLPYHPLPVHVAGLRMRVRARSRVLVFTRPDLDAAFFVKGTAVIIGDRRVLDVLAVVDRWLMVFHDIRAQWWVRMEDCEPIE